MIHVTLHEFKELLKHPKLQEAAKAGKDELIRVAKEMGYEITDHVLAEYAQDVELSDEDLDKVAGGLSAALRPEHRLPGTDDEKKDKTGGLGGVGTGGTNGIIIIS